MDKAKLRQKIGDLAYEVTQMLRLNAPLRENMMIFLRKGSMSML